MHDREGRLATLFRRRVIALLRVAVLTTAVSTSVPSAYAAEDTAMFMDRLTVCAGGLTLSIDANLLGSVRSIYEGDATKGTANLRTVGAFLQFIPPDDRLAAMELYHKCVVSILGNAYRVNISTADIRFMTNLPIEFYAELGNRGMNSVDLLEEGGLISALFGSLSVTYSISRRGCSDFDLRSYNDDQDYFEKHGFNASLNASPVFVQVLLLVEPFSVTGFLFSGSDWKHSFTAYPDANDRLESVQQLFGKCLYVEFYARSSNLRDAWMNQYTTGVFQNIRLTSFSVKLNERYEISPKNDPFREVYGDGLRKIWTTTLPSSVDDYRSP